MNTHVRQVAALIDDLFDLTRLEAQELEWTTERLEVRDLVHDVVDAMRPAADAGSVGVRAHVNGVRRPARTATASSSAACSST